MAITVRELLFPATVVSTIHEVLVELFRRQPELARELLRLCKDATIPGVRVEVGSIDLTQIAPAEFRADAVVIARDESGKAVHAVVVEIQLYSDPKKLFTWPVYVTALRARLECPVTLLVIAPEPVVAAWATREIVVGIGMSLHPIVISYDDVPSITEPIAPRVQPELSILSALAHKEETSVVQVALDELLRLPEDEQHVYFDLLNLLLPEALRRIDMDFKNYEFKSEFARKNRAQGREEGREEERRQLLRTQIAEKFGVEPSHVEDRLAKLDATQLQSLVTRILSAPSIEALFEGI